MTWIDWIFLGLNAITYAVSHYHGNKQGAATAAQVLTQYVPKLQDAVQGENPEGAEAGAVRGAAQYAASKNPAH